LLFPDTDVPDTEDTEGVRKDVEPELAEEGCTGMEDSFPSEVAAHLGCLISNVSEVRGVAWTAPIGRHTLQAWRL